MKTVIWTDEQGYMHRSALPDHAPDKNAPQGIPLDPPDMFKLLDWQGMGRTLWNLLVEYGITDWNAHQDQQGLLPAAIRQAIQNPLIILLKAETRNAPQPDAQPVIGD